MVEKDINIRWEEGMPHHPKAIEMAQIIEDADYKYGGDYFQFKFGGDGDNGEQLLYALSIYFELKEETNGKL
jgi:hypothetical protein